MPHNLTDDPTQFPAMQLPDAGDDRTAAFFAAALQALANRTAWLRNLLSNVKVIRFGTVAQMQALVVGSANNGEAFVVPRQGTYFYESAASDAPVVPWVYAPTGSGVAGRWVHELYGIIGTKGGLQSAMNLLDVSMYLASSSGGVSQPIFTTNSTSMVDVIDASAPAGVVGVVITNCLPGDILEIDEVPSFGLDSSSIASGLGNALSRLVALDGGTVVIPAGTLTTATDTPYNTAGRVCTVYTVANAGTVTIKRQLSVSTTSVNAIWLKPSSLRVRRTRP